MVLISGRGCTGSLRSAGLAVGWVVGFVVCLVAGQAAQAEPLRLLIAPQLTDERLSEAEPAHLVVYEPGQAAAPLLVWLPGTGGQPARGPQGFYDTALQQGYRLVALSYLNTPAVSQVCTGARLAKPDCAGRFRQHRVWGEPLTPLVADRNEDAIVPRLARLLQHLARSDAGGQWAQYLDGSSPRWARITLAGQSQGGGMAAYIAQTRRVAGVIQFSGGWDHTTGGDIAEWYGRPSVTPPEVWHATFHVQEVQAATMARIYQRLGVPAAQVHALSEPVVGRLPHGEGIGNAAYQPLWVQMLARPR